jgi:hypothetical protein
MTFLPHTGNADNMTRQIRLPGVWPKLNNSFVFSVLQREGGEKEGGGGKKAEVRQT